MSLHRRGRKRSRAASIAVFGLALVAYMGLVAAPASAAVTCQFASGALIINMDGADGLIIQLEDFTNQIEINGDSTTVACVSAEEATLANTTSITINGAGVFSQIVEIDLFNDVGETIDWEDIKWTIQLGDEAAGLGDQLAITNDGGDDDVSVTLGVTGVDLNTDGTVDIGTVGDVETFNLFGGPDDDTLWASGDDATGAPYPNALIITGDLGDDTIAGGAVGDTLDGDSGGVDDGTADIVDYSAATGPAIVNLGTNVGSAGGLGVDSLVSCGADNCFERIVGSANADNLTGDAADNRITPGAGDDLVNGAADTLSILPGDCDVAATSEAVSCGGDTVSFAGAEAAVTVDMGLETATGDGNDTLDNTENAIGSSNDDTFIDSVDDHNFYRGGDGNDLFDQGADVEDGDNDRIDGEGGVDTVDYSLRTEDLTLTLNSSLGAPGAVGTDTCDAASGDADCDDGDLGTGERDDVQGVENANLGSGNDSFVGSQFNNLVKPGEGQNVLDGGPGAVGAPDGIDTVNYRDRTTAVVVNFAGGGPATNADSAVDFENGVGTSKNDTMLGNNSANGLRGLGGNDTFNSGGGADFVNGGKGNDRARGGGGDDDLKGKAGNDFLRGGGGDDDLRGGKGRDRCIGGGGSDSLKGCERRRARSAVARANFARALAVRP